MVRALLVVASGLAWGCVDRGPGPGAKPADKAQLAAFHVAEVPRDLTSRVDADLGGKVRYLGTAIESTTVVPGADVTLRHYWQVVEAPGPGWRVFGSLEGAGAGSDFVPLDDSPLREAYGPSAWQAGDLLVDEQTFVVPPGWKAKAATVRVGLIREGGRDVSARMPLRSGPGADGAVVALQLAVDLAKAPPPPPPRGTVIVPRAAGAIAIDGVGADPGWAKAVTSPPFATAEGSPEPVGSATARLTWDDAALYVFASIKDTDVWSQYTADDAPLWKEDVLELFIDADGNRRGYVELQVNPNNAQFDSWFATTRAKPGDESWSAGMTSAVRVRGTADKRGDKDSGWDVEIAIPWPALRGRDDKMAVRLPPVPGDSLRMNIVRGDLPATGRLSASSWNPITYGDFHALDRMLTVIFADAAGETSPPAPTAPEAAAGSGSAAGSADPGGAGSAAGGGGSAAGTGSGAGSASMAGAGSGAGAGSAAPAPRLRRPSGAGEPATGSAATTP
ncbi:MAG: carbohydrate-binding family 9-like protein [Kofleriaceae bacterium]